MGMTRKFLSVGTYGLIDFKSDKERMAASARKTKSATRKGNRQDRRHNQTVEALLREQNELLRQQAQTPPQQAGGPTTPLPRDRPSKPWF